MASTRLPGKVLLEINGIPSIKFQIDRIRNSKVDDLVVATSTDSSDDVLVAYLKSINFEVLLVPL
jgi:spore coat polysaccharide biosynthesis protein SpsF (cytidylyltransferase family)